MATALTGGNQTLTLAILGTGAAADATIEAKDRGLGGLAGVHAGDHSRSGGGDNGKGEPADAAGQGIAGEGRGGLSAEEHAGRGAEEVENSLINMTADLLVSQEKSKWVANIGRYQGAGILREECVLDGAAGSGGESGRSFSGRHGWRPPLWPERTCWETASFTNTRASKTAA